MDDNNNDLHLDNLEETPAVESPLEEQQEAAELSEERNVENEVSEPATEDPAEKKTELSEESTLEFEEDLPEEPVVEEVFENPDPEFNCEPCKGSGLINQSTICPTCNGTGKVV